MPQFKIGEINKKYLTDFAGGVNLYLGQRDIKDNESPESINCDFKGKSGVGERAGYTEVGTVTDSRTAIYGLTEFHTASADQLIKFASDGADIELYYSTGAAWTEIATDSFTDAINIDTIQAGSKLYTANGTDVMRDWSGVAWADTTNGTKGYYPEYYDKRLWVVDETNADTLNFSGQYAPAASKLGDFADASAGTVTIRPGSGTKIRALKSFKNALYIFLYPTGIYRLTPASAANTFTVELITNAVGCASHRSVAQAGEDLLFAADDGVYSLGDVANFTEVRTTNRSAKVQEIFDSLSGTNKGKLVAKYHNFKYHLFYSLFGTNNDSCQVYDIRYQAWQDWRTMAANDATLFKDSNDEIELYFGEPTTGEVNQMYDGSTDNGVAIVSYWSSKSYDYKLADVLKKFKETTWIFNALQGTVNLYIIFDDSEVSSSKTLSQERPQGGFGRDEFGVASFGDATNTETITVVQSTPQRMKAKKKKFAIKYKVYSQGASWTLGGITQTYVPLHKFPSTNKIA